VIYFVGTLFAGAETEAAGDWNNFIEFNSVLYTPHVSGTPTSTQANKIIAPEDFFVSSLIEAPLNRL
jgi:hypothetical protein